MGTQSRRADCLDGPGVHIWSDRSTSKCPPSGQRRLLPASHCKICQIPTRCGGVLMLDTEAFREFKQGLTLLRDDYARSEEHTSELQSHLNLVCRLLLEKKKILI